VSTDLERGGELLIFVLELILEALDLLDHGRHREGVLIASGRRHLLKNT